MLRSIRRRLQRISWRRSSEQLLAGLGPDDRELVARIRSSNLTFLSPGKLASILVTCRSIEASGLPGAFIEAGCALGGSAVAIATAKKPGRPLFLYDVFAMIPPPTKDDPKAAHERYKTIVEGKSEGFGGEKYYGYRENLQDVVRSNLARFGIECEERSVSLVKGLVQETLAIDQPVAFAHIDVDWYDPVMACLRRIGPRLVVGGSMVLDDYFDWGGCTKATDEYLRAVPGEFVRDDEAGHLRITRVAAPR
jgi:asparagine synthase (glutamine-hydrolysing)